MEYLITAHRIDDSQILGNLDGQAVIRAKDIRRTYWYKSLKSGEGRPKYPRVSYWLVSQGAVVIERIENEAQLHSIL